MAELKFIEKEIPVQVEDMQSGMTTDYMFMMYRSGDDGWYKNTVLPADTFSVLPMSSAACFGVAVKESVRIVGDKNGKICFAKAENVIDSLNNKGKSLGLPEVDTVYASYALRELVRIERRFLSDDSMLVAHLTLASCDNTACYPVSKAVFTIGLEYRKIAFTPVSLCADVCPVLELRCGSGEYQLAQFKGSAAAQAMGYDGVMWLDCVYRKYVSSSSCGEIFFRIGDNIVTPDTECNYISAAVKKLISEWGISISQRKLSVDQLMFELENSNVAEAFTVNVGDLICPVTEIDLGEKTYSVPQGKLARKLFDSMLNIERGILLFPAAKIERI